MPISKKPLFEIKLPWYKVEIAREKEIYVVRSFQREKLRKGRFSNWSNEQEIGSSQGLADCVGIATNMIHLETRNKEADVEQDLEQVFIDYQQERRY